MKKNPIGFNMEIHKESEINVPMEVCKGVIEPKRSVVRVYFPQREMSLVYYNDSFDLKVGDFVYVEGKLEGFRGQVTEVNYSFKIKPSDYMKVIAVIDTNVKGDFYIADSHMVTFDKSVIPFSKVRTWFNAPCEEEYVCGNDDSVRFPLDDLSKMKIGNDIAERGFEYFMEDRVAYLEIDRNHGRAIVEGGKNYEVEFDYIDGEISNIKCSCFCSGVCKHEFAVMLQLRETADILTRVYETEYNDYFALISKRTFISTIMAKKVSGKISLEV